MSKERNPVGKRGSDALHCECRNKAMEKNKLRKSVYVEEAFKQNKII